MKTAASRAYCNSADVPYVGCDVLSSALGMDKIVQKRLFSHAGLPIVDYLVVPPTTVAHTAQHMH